MKRWPTIPTPRSMRVRILAVVVGLVLLSTLGSSLLLRAVLLDRLDEEIIADLQQEAAEFELLEGGTDPATGQPFADLESLFDVYFSREVPDEGESLLAFVDGELHDSRRAQDGAAADELDEPIAYWLSLEQDRTGSIETALGTAQYVVRPLEAADGTPGHFVVANFPLFEAREIDEAVRLRLLIELLTLLVVAGLGLVLAGRVLRPLRDLAVTAQDISETDLSRRIPVSGRDEASRIAATFNDMLTRLEQALGNQRRFLDEASHELRTPLTVVRGHAELLEIDDSPEGRAETVALITDEVDRMSTIVDGLFTLARTEQPDFVTLRPVDAAEVVRETYRKATALADREWVLEVDDDVPVLADRHRLTQALLQLADNAVKHTADHDAIALGVARRDGRACLWVDDAGSGVPENEAERIFQRFQRLEAPGDHTGAGLGLAIVQAIAVAHHGSVGLAPKDRPGARFEIWLPLRA
ncbi:sensor histidine kinase [Nocardioides aequoreus]|uniref:sensor histidine kinase n=1 Tax=Nocardioides aequoreus TaxID=397278 RepID=UPI0004C46435|nr:HAMP domain-containing sensor histidine kinase [Nocardioides aequoreus]